jgi:hypothetical protein
LGFWRVNYQPTAVMLTYSDLLRDPRWQKKRLEIMERDKFRCRKCDDATSTLHVHHTYYWPEPVPIEYRTPPWDYDNQSLVTLCHRCHEDEEECKAGLDHFLVLHFRMAGALNNQILKFCETLSDLGKECGSLSGALALVEVAMDDLCTEYRKRNGK